MGTGTTPPRLLLVDDNADIHRAYDKVLARRRPTREIQLANLEAALFGLEPEPEPEPEPERPSFELVHANQGEDALSLVQASLAAGGAPFSVAFIDVRMPPGIDGIETARRLWSIDPRIQVVICTAHSDYEWQDMVERLGERHDVRLLRKPFDAAQVEELALTLHQRYTTECSASRP
jgi:CheY-like chemotaxis protein